MLGKKFLLLGSAIGLSLLLSIFYTNCSQGSSPADESSAEKTRVEGLSGVNYFREPVPDRFCGQEGFGYLLRSYIGPECGSCHSMNGMFPPFGDSDIAKSYTWAKALGKDNFLSKVLDNRFCGPACNLDPRGEIYKGLAEWLDHRDNCN